MDPCPDPNDLGAYLERALPPGEASLLIQAHLADCERCRGRALLVARLEPEAGRRPWTPWAAAAAALLLTAVLGWQFSRPAPSVSFPPAPSPPAPPVVAEDRLETREAARGWILPGGTRLALAPGSLAQREADGTLLLKQGTLWLEEGSSLALIRTPLGSLQSQGAECLIRLEEPPLSTAFFLPEARASEPGQLTVACFSGTLRIEGQTLGPDTLLAWVPGKASPVQPLTPARRRDLLAWLDPLREQRIQAGGRLEGREAKLPLLAPGPGDYTLEVTLRAKRPEGDLGLAFPADGTFPYWVFALRELGQGPCRLSVRRHADTFLLDRDGRTLASLEARHARSMERWAEAPTLTVWGGAVEVLEVKVTSWRRIP